MAFHPGQQQPFQQQMQPQGIYQQSLPLAQSGPVVLGHRPQQLHGQQLMQPAQQPPLGGLNVGVPNAGLQQQQPAAMAHPASAHTAGSGSNGGGSAPPKHMPALVPVAVHPTASSPMVIRTA